MQCDADGDHAKRGLAERRHLRRHPEQDHRDLRCFEKTLIFDIFLLVQNYQKLKKNFCLFVNNYQQLPTIKKYASYVKKENCL